MNDNKFDDFVNNKLNEYAAPVPAGLWEKVAEGQLDQFIGSKLKDTEVPVPTGLWEKITDNQFDNFVADKIEDHQAPVPGTLWDRITDGQFDNFVAGKFENYEAPVPAGLWDKITDGQFDAFVAGKLIDHEAPVPAGLWEKVRPQEDDDKPGFFWFRYPAAAAIILAILTAAAWGGYMYFTSKKNTTPQTTQVGAPGKSVADGSTPSTETKKTTDNNNTIVPPVANDAKATTSPADGQPVNAVPSLNSTGVSKDKTTNTITENTSDEKPNGTNRSASSRGNTVQSSNTTKATENKLPPPPANNANNNNLAINPYDPLKNKMGIVDKSTDQTTAKEDDIYLPPFQPNFSSVATVPFGFNYYPVGKQLSTINHTNQFKSVIICPSDKKGNTDWLLEVYASPDIAMKSVSNISASSLYMLKKDSSEAMQIGYSAGIRLVKPITDNILLKAGINYTQANQKYVYRTENEVKTTTVVTVRTIIRAPGDTVIVQDTSVLQTIGFKNNTVNNRYRSFDIPVTVGYQFGDEDLKLGINAGVVFNISSSYQGVMLDSTLAVVPLNKTGNGVYKTNLGLGLYGSISVVKKLSEGMHIFAEPYFRYNLSDMTTPQANFKQKFSFGGLQIGLRFNINSKY